MAHQFQTHITAKMKAYSHIHKDSDLSERASKMRTSNTSTEEMKYKIKRSKQRKVHRRDQVNHEHRSRRKTYGINTEKFKLDKGESGETVGLPTAAIAPCGSFDSRMQRPLQ